MKQRTEQEQTQGLQKRESYLDGKAKVAIANRKMAAFHGYASAIENVLDEIERRG